MFGYTGYPGLPTQAQPSYQPNPYGQMAYAMPQGGAVDYASLSGNGLGGGLPDPISGLQKLGINLDPQQVAAIRAQMTPENMARAQAMMANPAIRAKMAQMMTLARNGQLTPDMMQQMMANGGLAGGMNPEMGLESAPLTPGQLMQVGIISGVLGLGSGWAISRFMNHIHNNTNPGWLENGLKAIERLPGVAAISNHLSNAIEGSTSPTNVLRSLDAAVTREEVSRSFVQSFFGPNGHYMAGEAGVGIEETLRRAVTPTGGVTADTVLNHLRSATTPQHIHRVLDADPMHFLPESIQQAVKDEVGNLKPGRFTRFMRRLGIFSTPPAPTLSLGVVDNWHAQHELIQAIEQRFTSGTISQSAYESATTALGKQFGRGFEARLANALAADTTNALRQTIATSLSVPVASIQTHTAEQLMTLVRNMPGRQAIWQQLNNNTNGLLTASLGATETSTWGAVARSFEQNHIATHLKDSNVFNQLFNRIRGFFNHASSMEHSTLPMVAERHALREALKNRGIGPVGRFFASLGYDLQRTLSGTRYRSLGGRAIMDSSPALYRVLGSLGMSFLTFGFAVSSAYKAPKESRTARFFDALATGLGGFMGFEMGQRLIAETGLMTRWGWFSRLCTRTIPLINLTPWKPTWGGFIGTLVIPAILGWGISTLFQKPMNWIFGNPEKIEKKLQAKKLADLQKQQEADMAKQAKQAAQAAKQQPTAVYPNQYPTQYPTNPGWMPNTYPSNNAWANYYGNQQPVPYATAAQYPSAYPQMMPQQPVTTSRPQPVATNTVVETPKLPVAKRPPIKVRDPKRHHGISREELRSNPTERELVATAPEDDKHFMGQLWGLH